MDKQIIAEQLEASIIKHVQDILTTIPSKLDKDNLDLFVNICNSIDAITSNAFTEAERLGCRDFFSGRRRLFIPYWKFYNKYEVAYGEYFSWHNYLFYAIECQCTDVEIILDDNNPGFYLIDDKCNKQFLVSLEKED